MQPIILHIDLGNQSLSNWLKDNRYVIYSELVRYSEKLINERLELVQAILVSNLADNIVFIIKQDKMTEDLQMIYDDLKESNGKSLSHFETELLKIRASKATPAMLNGVMVEYYGAMTPLQQIANVSTLDARTITVQPWEKQSINDIAKGILNANLGLNPQSNGEQLLISVPPLTEERRRELVKRAKSEAETAKVGIRTNRKDALDLLKDLKNDGLSEDLCKDSEDEIQKITNSFIKKIDDLVEVKEKDIMTI